MFKKHHSDIRMERKPSGLQVVLAQHTGFKKPLIFQGRTLYISESLNELNGQTVEFCKMCWMQNAALEIVMVKTNSGKGLRNSGFLGISNFSTESAFKSVGVFSVLNELCLIYELGI